VILIYIIINLIIIKDGGEENSERGGKIGECYDGEVRKGCECRKTENDKWSFAKI